MGVVDGLGLAEAVRELRAELVASQADSEGEDLRFALGEITVELKAVITKTGTGKLGWKIIEVGGAVESEATQTITLTLTPLAKSPATGKYEANPLVTGDLDDKGGGRQDPDAAADDGDLEAQAGEAGLESDGNETPPAAGAKKEKNRGPVSE